MNLSQYIRTAKLFVNGEKQKFAFQDLPEYKLSFLKTAAPKGHGVSIELIFSDFHETFYIPQNNASQKRRILAAISKNNAAEWVATWADFHRHNYGLDDVIVYDNGSDNIQELEIALDGKAKIINWNFPYGPPGKRFNKFAQPGALNHCLRKFCRRGTLFNFDIDELLIANPPTLEEEIKRNKTVYIDSHNVPKTKNLTSPYTHYDFKLRDVERRKKARKFVCSEATVDIISQHNTWKHSKIPFTKKLRRNKPKKLESDHAYFLHFLGITTNWQPSLGKLNIVPKDNLTEDESHIKRKPPEQ